MVPVAPNISTRRLVTASARVNRKWTLAALGKCGTEPASVERKRQPAFSGEFQQDFSGRTVAQHAHVRHWWIS